MSSSDAYQELGGTPHEPRRPRVGFVPGAWCPLHVGYPIETHDGRCARCRREQEE